MQSSIDAPPVRYSVGQDDFDPAIGKRLRIYVNGVLQDKVVEYDCEAGTLLRYRLDLEGKITLSPDKRAVETETVRGDVTVEWAD